jgi:hypothetical protein
MNAVVELPTEDEAKVFAKEFVLGEMIKACTKHLKTLAVPWIELKEREQERVLEQVNSDCRRILDNLVDVVAGNARLVFKAQVAQVTFKDGVKAQIELINSPEAHELANSVGKVVTIVIEDRTTLLDVGDALQTDPDQPPLFDVSTEGTQVH